MKTCFKCKIEKEVSEFPTSKRNKDGRHSWCRECKTDYRRTQYLLNKEKEATQHKIWVSNNQERRRLQNVKATTIWQSRNQDKVKHWKNNNKHKRRASEKSGDLTLEQWIELCNKYGNACLSCGKSGVTIDHVVPLSKGGTHTIDNVQPLCGKCNSIKHDKTIDYRSKDE